MMEEWVLSSQRSREQNSLCSNKCHRHFTRRSLVVDPMIAAAADVEDVVAPTRDEPVVVAGTVLAAARCTSPAAAVSWSQCCLPQGCTASIRHRSLACTAPYCVQETGSSICSRSRPAVPEIDSMASSWQPTRRPCPEARGWSLAEPLGLSQQRRPTQAEAVKGGGTVRTEVMSVRHCFDSALATRCFPGHHRPCMALRPEAQLDSAYPVSLRCPRH